MHSLFYDHSCLAKGGFQTSISLARQKNCLYFYLSLHKNYNINYQSLSVHNLLLNIIARFNQIKTLDKKYRTLTYPHKSKINPNRSQESGFKRFCQ